MSPMQVLHDHKIALTQVDSFSFHDNEDGTYAFQVNGHKGTCTEKQKNRFITKLQEITSDFWEM